MKIRTLLAAIAFAYSTYASANEISLIDNYYFLGMDMKAGMMTCVESKTQKGNLAEPVIKYELSVKPESKTTAKIIASLIVYDQFEEITELKMLPTVPGGLQYNKICGSEYISRTYWGAYFSYKWTVSVSDAQNISAITMVESQSSRAAEFFNYTDAQIKKLTTISAYGMAFAGTDKEIIEMMNLAPIEAFEAYKKKVINDKSIRRTVSGEISTYP